MPTRNLPPALARLIRVVTWTENALLIAMLALMVLLAAAQILFRNFFDMSIFGADQLLRLLVLWVAFLGAVAASREGKHIHVDAIARWLPGRFKSGVVAVTDLFTLAVCLVLAWQALRFMQSAHESGEMVFGTLPVWVAASILPLAFTLIALRYALRFMHHVQQFRGREAAE
ncbi:ectoine TRAP transporter small permease protein TeaB [mine drainage metagenome]|uniref:Ectoine TRAP transporter small permease protein TeaB n=1 Tax=mine drainage metagenome TaxID=410659 RepID=A0A1J5RGK4_9ZZZZ